MDDLYKEYVISYFDRTVEIHGDRPEALRWSTPGQKLHYECLLDVAPDLCGKILDYGCGKGDLYDFLANRGLQVEYTGCDINSRLIEMAREKHPGCSFHVFDVEEEDLHEDFDYIFLVGVFNLKVDGLGKTIKNVLKKLFGHCRKALAFNALSAHCPVKSYELNYLHPEEFFKFAVQELSPYVTLRHDKIFHDFFLFIYVR
ncbi:MAG: class I SAM-dependent methyltransferase [Nitrospirae bacterium]|nr:class I SAM-dependent methyltransferase [Nitrospirota bacterium]